ncbi:MAG: septum formation initiator family protein [Microthrixaceae bacterium]
MIELLRARLAGVPRWVWRVLVGAGVAAFAAVVLAAPLGNWWDQRNQIRAAEDELALIEADNEALRGRLDSISDPETIERIARQDLGLVREGEESYTILPPSTAGLVMPDTWPFDRLAGAIVAGQ